MASGNSEQRNGSPEWIRLRRVNGKIYALGNYTMASNDNGQSFSKVDSSPLFAPSIFSLNDKITINNMDLLWQSSDNGLNFNVWKSTLQ